MKRTLRIFSLIMAMFFFFANSSPLLAINVNATTECTQCKLTNDIVTKAVATYFDTRADYLLGKTSSMIWSVNGIAKDEQLHLAKYEGLSHYLSGMANVNDLVVSTDIPGMYVMFAGVLVPNASELLGGEAFKRLIPALKDVFDYVIVDTPPLGQVIDCAIMAPQLDGTIIVMDTTNNSYKMEKRMVAQLEKSGGKILGVILNRVSFEDRGRYYGKDYAYGDYNEM